MKYQEAQILAVNSTIKCDVCNLYFAPHAVDTHHAILTKGEVRGLPKIEKTKIDTPENLAVVHRQNHKGIACHQIAHAFRIIPAASLIMRYGAVKVDEMLNSMTWKVSRPSLALSYEDASNITQAFYYYLIDLDKAYRSTASVVENFRLWVEPFTDIAPLLDAPWVSWGNAYV